MAFDAVPYVIDGTTVDGEVIRRALGTLLNPAGGIVTPGDLNVTQQGTPNMSVQIGTGQVWVPGTSTPSQGMYYSRNGAAITVPISASNPSNPRVDTIIVQVQDAAYAGAARSLAATVVNGTPTAGVTVPPTTAAAAAADGAGAVPASSYVLAWVLVPAAATSIVTADIANVALARAGLSQMTSVNTTASALTATNFTSILAYGGTGQTITLPAGQTGATIQVTGANQTGATPVVVQTTGGQQIIGVGAIGVTSVLLGTPGATATFFYDGASWLIVAGQQDTGWIALTPLTSPLVSAGGVGGSAPEYRKQGDLVRLQGQVYNPSGSAFASATMATLPVGFRPPGALGFIVYYGGVAAPLSIAANGAVVAGVGAGAQISLDGVSFPTTS